MTASDPTTALVRALARSGPALTLISADSRSWASATFTGDRHVIAIEAADTALLAAWLGGLPAVEWTLPRLLVADLVAVAVERADGRARITIEALTLDRA
jgi:hypothetical protein